MDRGRQDNESSQEIGTHLQQNLLAPDEPLIPGPEYERGIKKERWFELTSVIVLIVCGFAYLMWKGETPRIYTDDPQTLAEAAIVVQGERYTPTGQSIIHNLHFSSFEKDLGEMSCTVDLVGTDPQNPCDMAIITLNPPAGTWNPSEQSLQRAVDEVASIGSYLLGSSGEALLKAVNTMVDVSDAERPHDKGVAGTKDGWKITYITYREHDEQGDAAPAVHLILQTMASGSDPALATFNRALYAALNQGTDLKSALIQAEPPEVALVTE